MQGEFHNIHGTIGAPFVIGNQGVERIIELPLEDCEKELLISNVDKVNTKIQQFIPNIPSANGL